MPSSPASTATLHARRLDVVVAGRTLVTAADLTVGPGTRLGLVGPNGTGKTLLLSTLAGLHAPGGGSIATTPPDATVGYLPQEVRPVAGETGLELLARRTGVADASAELDRATRALADSGTSADDPTGNEPADKDTAAAAKGTPAGDPADRYSTALDRWLSLGGADLDTRAPAALDDVGLPHDLLCREVGALSGGQRARLQLAALLLARYDVLLLDEPTNDLDLDGLERLESLVLSTSGPLLTVSHDRAFLARTVTAVAEIDPHERTLTRYDGGWASYLDERDRAAQRARDAYETYVDRRNELRDRARRQREWAARGVGAARRSGETDKFIRHRHSQSAQKVGSRARTSEDALARLDPVDKPWEGWQLRLTIADAGPANAEVARLDGAVVERDRGNGAGPFRLGPVDLLVRNGDRVALVGPNGAGKSTLLHALLGRLPLAAGQRHLGPRVVVGEIGQRRDDLEDAATLLDGFMAATGLHAAGEARSVLAKFGLSAEHVQWRPADLSPGERTRAALAAFQARGVNTLVLDEPTNHLDLVAIEQLEQALGNFDGTLLVVSHDRDLLTALACDRYVDVAHGVVTER